MTERFGATTELLKRARHVTPSGTQTRSKAVTQLVEGVSPGFLVRGENAHVWDVDGHEYIDLSMGLAAVGLGYCYPAVDRAVHAQVDRGATFSLATPLEAEVAERLCDMIPCAESVRFVKSGSEATEAAMRIARVATGRDVILSVGYHGWGSVYDAAKPVHPGVPESYALAIVELPYNDLRAVEQAFSERWRRQAILPGASTRCVMELPADEIAAVIIEPVLHERPAPDYLYALRKLCTEAGALLIFDEVVTGFRWANGGAQQHWGVIPDLACLGKAMANGYPLGAVVGRREIMEAGARFVSPTFGGEAVSLAAAKATLDVYQTRPVITRIWSAGRDLQARVQRLSEAHGSPITMDGYACKPRFTFRPDLDEGLDTPEIRRLIMSILIQELIAGGVLIHPASLNVAYTLFDSDLDQIERAVERALSVIEHALTTSDLSRWLLGAPHQPSLVRAALPR